MSDFLQRLENLSPEKRELVLQKLKQQQSQKSNNQRLQKPSLIPISREQDIPLSWAQTRLWFVNKLEGESSAYTADRTLCLQGNLNLQALEQAFQALIQRHEPLRTQFKVKNNQPIQVIAPNVNFQLPVVNLQNLKIPTEEVKHLLAQAVSEPFDLANGSVLRVKLWQVANDKYILLIAIHHIAADGWSFGILIRELSAYYQSFCTGTIPPYPPLPIQYADFAVWQRQWFTDEVLDRQLGYWQKKLAGVPLLHQLPSDRPRPPVQSFRGGTAEFHLDRDLTEQLKQLSQRSGCTLFMTLLAGFAVLLSRHSSQTDIVIGSPIANRNRTEIEGLIGFFVNTLPLRFNLSENPSFEQFLAQVRATTEDAYDHQDLPFEKLIEALQPERHLDRNPLVQILFSLENVPRSPWDLPGLTVTEINSELDSVRLDLEVSLSDLPNGLEGVCYYNRDLFDGETITRLMSHFRVLLTAIAQNPHQPIGHLPLLTPQEEQLLKVWNDTHTDYAYDKCIHQLVEEQTERTPDAVAVVFENQSLTYAQLNQKANQLAHYLRELGVETETLIGLSVERSLDMIVALLGILKAGAAYLPLDPEYPPERLRFMLENAEVSVLLSQQRLIEKLPEYQAQLVCLDTDWPIIAEFSQENFNVEVQPHHLGYVIYTSGSTGQPKGVAMSQLALCNLILWQWQNTTVANHAKTLQFAPISFDVSFQEIFSTLCSGGTLVLITEELRRDANALLIFIEEKAIERLFLPFVALNQLAEVSVTRGFIVSNLREVITAGEQLRITPAIADWFKSLSNCTLHNHYGPSESHVVTSFTLPQRVETWPLLPAIGRPIANTQIYLLDSHLQPVPIGVPGELYIGGIALARSYLNRPELTEEKFITDPFSSDRHSRLYKTGDLARYLTDGNIEYLGRIDHQVKVRGFRIELGEIEATLSEHHDVQEAVVIACSDQGADSNTLNTHLVAYLVPVLQEKLLAEQELVSQVQKFLQETLPSYMVPQGFVLLQALPLTPSGKVDRKSLPTTDLATRNLTTGFLAPRTPTEAEMVTVWGKILGIDGIGVNDNFFKMGGHSLLATQLVTRIRDQFKLDLPLNKIFEYPILKDLANYLDTYLWYNQSADSEPLNYDEEEIEL
jgi:amino acid adenylation domain-containing protein